MNKIEVLISYSRIFEINCNFGVPKHYLVTDSQVSVPVSRSVEHTSNGSNPAVPLKVAYKQKHDAEKGLSDYAHMKEPPEVRHAMEVNRHQSNVSKLVLHNFLEK